MARLVLVTNREPFQLIASGGGLPQWERTTGGLVSALEPAISRLGGVWISSASPHIGNEGQDWPFEWLPLCHEPGRYHDYYAGFANGVLWPLFHSLVSSGLQFKRNEWEAYNQVNRDFADACLRVMKHSDLVWVHDYQLCLVPKALRDAKMPDAARVGFFLHIPFPPYDIFRILPFAREILLGLLGADVIAFHTRDYLLHFMDAVAKLLPNAHCDSKRNLIRFEGRTIRGLALPIGIDARGVHKISQQKATKQKANALKKGAPTLLVGVDRLDYTKGLLRKLRALEIFFDRYPHRRGSVSLIQVAVPTRGEIDEYRALRAEIEKAVGHINGLYARPGWVPVTYICRSLPHGELVALYQAADIALVTPLRDGMNLVAKEYVATHKSDDGVLILSELAGAAKDLKQALLVNPYDVFGMAEAIEQALLMPKTEQRQRMRALCNNVFTHDVHAWIQRFLKEVQKT